MKENTSKNFKMITNNVSSKKKKKMSTLFMCKKRKEKKDKQINIAPTEINHIFPILKNVHDRKCPMMLLMFLRGKK